MKEYRVYFVIAMMSSIISAVSGYLYATRGVSGCLFLNQVGSTPQKSYIVMECSHSIVRELEIK